MSMFMRLSLTSPFSVAVASRENITNIVFAVVTVKYYMSRSVVQLKVSDALEGHIFYANIQKI